MKNIPECSEQFREASKRKNMINMNPQNLRKKPNEKADKGLKHMKHECYKQEELKSVQETGLRLVFKNKLRISIFCFSPHSKCLVLTVLLPFDFHGGRFSSGTWRFGNRVRTKPTDRVLHVRFISR